MDNVTKIILFQNFPEQARLYLNFIFNKLNITSNNYKLNFIENINYFEPEKPKNKKALLTLSPSAWVQAIKEYPNIKKFNYVGLTFEIVRALNLNGYLVDISDVNTVFYPQKDYDLLIGHGGKCKQIIDNLKKDAKIIQYVSGEFWEGFNKESEERYNAFCERKNIKEKLTFKRSLDGLIEGENYLTEKADILFTINFPRMVNSFDKYKSKFHFTGFGAYPDELLYVPVKQKDYDFGRKNFIYVGGTGGNIQKGMDLLIKAFLKTPELNLYIYCKVEEEILKYYKKELNNKNIHYIYHWRFLPYRNRLKELMERIVFTIHAPINTGLGTAFMGSMLIGLIPVGYVDLEDGLDFAVLSNSWQIDDLVKVIKEASKKSPEWCKEAAKKTIEYSKKNWSVESFRKKFNEMINGITNE